MVGQSIVTATGVLESGERIKDSFKMLTSLDSLSEVDQ